MGRANRVVSRWRSWLLPLVVAVLALAAFGFAAASTTGGWEAVYPIVSRATAATTTEIQRYEDRTQRVAGLRFTAVYRVRARGRQGQVFRGTVLAAQRDGDAVYRESGTRDWPNAPGLAVYEVFSLKDRGYFSCSKRLTGSPWRCVGPYRGIGMGGSFMLWGEPYLPDSLPLSLSNAIDVDDPHVLGSADMQPGPDRPTFLLSRRVAGHRARCLELGSRQGSLGQVCILASGLIALYRIPGTSPDIQHQAARIVSYSRAVSRRLFSLPARPSAIPYQ